MSFYNSSGTDHPTQSFKNPRDPAPCLACGAALPLYRHSRVYMCQPCKDKEFRGVPGLWARQILAKAIYLGWLPKASKFTCVDCGNPATEYDHRDYNRPLEVEAVCHRCNVARGPAIPKRIEEKEKK